MKNWLCGFAVSLCIGTSAQAGVMVYCQEGRTQSDAISILAASLNDQSGVLKAYDSNNSSGMTDKYIYLKISDVSSVSSMIVVPYTATGSYEACVSLTGKILNLNPNPKLK